MSLRVLDRAPLVPAPPKGASTVSSHDDSSGLRADDVDAPSPVGDSVEDRNSTDQGDRRRFLDFGLRGSYTKLGRTKRQLDRRLNQPLKTDVFGIFNHPRTPLDRKTDMHFGAFVLGAGRDESDHFSWVWYLAGGSGKDESDQRFLNLRLRVRFKYLAILTGVRGEFYPWGRPQFEAESRWTARLAAGRPFLLGGVETGFLRGSGAGRYTISSVPAYRDAQTNQDWVVGFPLGAGWRLPIDERLSFVLFGDYTFHVYRPDEYNGWNVTAALRFNY